MLQDKAAYEHFGIWTAVITGGVSCGTSATMAASRALTSRQCLFVLAACAVVTTHASGSFPCCSGNLSAAGGSPTALDAPLGYSTL